MQACRVGGACFTAHQSFVIDWRWWQPLSPGIVSFALFPFANICKNLEKARK